MQMCDISSVTSGFPAGMQQVRVKYLSPRGGARFLSDTNGCPTFGSGRETDGQQFRVNPTRMATDLSQDAVLRFLQDNGGSAKNSDLLLHFKNFIRDNEDRNRNRELFKKYVNTVASVRQDAGVSYVVLRKQFKGYVPPGGGSGPAAPPWAPVGRNTDPSPRSPNLVPAVSTEKSQLKTAAPPGQTVGKTVLPAAGIMVNNNNNMRMDVNIKNKQFNSPAELSGRRAAAAQVGSQITEKAERKLPTRSEPHSQDQPTKAGHRVGFGPLPGVAPVAPVVRHHGETSRQVAAPQTLKGREVWPEGGLHQEPPGRVSLESEVIPRRRRYRPSYKSAISCDDDDDEDEQEEAPVRRSSGGAVWPQSAPLKEAGRVMSTSSPCVIDPPAPPSVASSSASERSLPKIFIQDMERDLPSPRGPGRGFESGLELRGQPAGRGLQPVALSGQSTRHIVHLEAEHYTPPPDPGPHHDTLQGRRYPQPQDPKVLLSSSYSSMSSPSSDGGFSSSDWPPSGSSRGSGWSSTFEDLQAKTGTRVVLMARIKLKND